MYYVGLFQTFQTKEKFSIPEYKIVNEMEK